MIRFLTDTDAQNLDLVGVLVHNINLNYSETEDEFWKDGVKRTSIPLFQEEIRNKNVLAYFEDDQVLGSINFEIREDEAKFSILSVNLDAHGKGVGTALFNEMIRILKEKGVKKLHLVLLIPRHYQSEYKEFVFQWYIRNGFKPGNRMKTEDLDYFPSQDLKIESDFIEMSKDL